MRKFHIGLAASTFALVLAACGGDASSDGSEQAAENESSSEATVAAPAEVEAFAPSADDIATLDGTTLADFTGDAAAGEKVFIQCRACHVVDEGVNRVGPSLAGIIGRTSGTVEGFSYTEANANSGITWTPEKMFQYLENPQRVMPGTRMAFAGLKDGQDRADIVAYLQAN